MNQSIKYSRLSKRQTAISYILRTIVVVIFVQSLFFKFSAAPESMYIFSKLGIEPWGRILTGIAELIASILILLPLTVAQGALFSLIIISGALGSHFFSLGIAITEVGDDGMLFILALVVFAASAATLYLHRHGLLVCPIRKLF